MAIEGRDADELLDALHRQDNFRGYVFQGLTEGQENEPDGKSQDQLPSPSVAPDSNRNADVEATDESLQTKPMRSRGRPKLQTRLIHDKLERRLIKIYREARTLEEEQGLSTLHLALGFIKWFDSDHSEEPSFAPLILVPVTLDRVQGRDGYVLNGRDDDILVNVSLKELLFNNFGIKLPDIPDDEDWTPSQYFRQVEQAISRQRRFEVDQSIGLGFFSFSKFMMWRDLDVSTWPDENLLENDLLRILVGGIGTFESEPQIVSDDEPIEHKIDLSKSIHVVDADSSQAIVIEEVRHNRNLVVQGPPGTGKSQTITNIIASAVHMGRSVLFVAEKTAALQVVHDRLKRAGLSTLCLEMHSRKANKREVLKSLEEALRFSGDARINDTVSNKLAECRDQLNAWSKFIHTQIGQSGKSTYDVIGTQLKLRGEKVRLLDVRLDEIGDWSSDKIATAERATERAAAALIKILVPAKDHPWFDTGIDPQSQFDIDRLSERLRLVVKHLDALAKQLNAVSPHITGSGEASLQDAKDFVSALRHVAAVPSSNRSALTNNKWITDLPTIEAAIRNGNELSTLSNELENRLHREAWQFDTAPLLLTLRADGSSFFRWFSKRYRQGRADLRAICKSKPPKQLDERIALIEMLRDAQERLKTFTEQKALLASVLGPTWNDQQTSWKEAIALADWTRVALSLVGNKRLLELASRTKDLEIFKAFSNQLETAIREFENGFVELIREVKPGPILLLGLPSYQQVPLSAVQLLCTLWLTNIDAVNDWVSARMTLEELCAVGLAPVADRLKESQLRPAEAISCVKLLIAEALWKRAIKDNPILQKIDGNIRTEKVEEFANLDTRRIQISQQEVLSKYLSQKPSGYAGDMGVIRQQIEKKRGHMPLRKLMIHAGPAIQLLKPVFLMSPLSAAQFLAPGQLKFDLLVVDEASQVSPEDAFGSVARTKQIVVVGDHKQLPPTNFFKMVNAGGDEPEIDENELANPDRTGDYESILTLARARGMSERLLAWHYRSKHPSLIALSNYECYGGRLLLPPSPFVQTSDFGLSFVQTPRGHYDRGGTSRDLVQAEQVAKAIIGHIKEFPNKSLGVACLSVQQRDAVDDAIDRLGIRLDVETFASKSERLFVKNLESVQGDERDVVFISVGYGVAPDHTKPFLNFGPVSREGGDRRLNVLASRAREKCVVFSSITASDIPADTLMPGTRMLRALLHYAETGKLGAGNPTGKDFESHFEEAVAQVIREAGYDVHAQVGVSNFRVDLGVIDRSRPGHYILGVECDGATYHSARSARDRDRLRQEVLEARGWQLHRIWSTDWFRNPRRQSERLIAAIREATKIERTPLTDDIDADAEKENDQLENESLSNGAILDDEADTSVRYSNVQIYEECALTVPVRRALLDLSISELGRLAKKVVETEGPIHAEEIARRIREAFRLQKTGNRILSHVKSSLNALEHNGSLIRDGEFWAIPGRTANIIRHRRNAALPLRKANMIAPGEYQLAISTALNDAVRLSPDELYIEVARLFGFDRTGPDLKTEIERQIQILADAGTVVIENGKIGTPSRGRN